MLNKPPFNVVLKRTSVPLNILQHLHRLLHLKFGAHGLLPVLTCWRTIPNPSLSFTTVFYEMLKQLSCHGECFDSVGHHWICYNHVLLPDSPTNCCTCKNIYRSFPFLAQPFVSSLSLIDRLSTYDDDGIHCPLPQIPMLNPQSWCDDLNMLGPGSGAIWRCGPVGVVVTLLE